MKRPPWRPVPSELFALSSSRAPAYLAPGGALGLYNDYEEGTSLLVRGAGAPAPDEVGAIWCAGARGPGR